MNVANLPASVQSKLLNRAKAERREYMQLLTRYGLERLLYRLSISEHAENFLLKGALLFDLWVLSEHESFNYETLAKAIRATLTRRKTQMPSRIPLGLSDEFSGDPDKRRQWGAFLSKNRLTSPLLESVVERLRNWLLPAIRDTEGHPDSAWSSAKRWH